MGVEAWLTKRVKGSIMKSTIVAVVTFTIGTTSALAQVTPPKPGSPMANFRDDVVLARAKEQVSQMQRHELDLLTDALATCQVTGLSEDDAVRRQCEIARARYELAYNSGRFIDQILGALESNVRVTRMRGNLPRGHPDRDEVTEDIELAITKPQQGLRPPQDRHIGRLSS